MNSDFDFDKIGRREPYVVPGDFFQRLEESIIAGTVEKPRRRPYPWRIILACAASVAAAIIVVVVYTGMASKHSYAIEDVEQVFAELSEADQDYLLETYQDDIFMNQ